VKRNILFFADASKYYQVRWDSESSSFSIEADDESKLIFAQSGQVFTRNFNVSEANLTTVKENKTKFTSSEVERATLARELSQRLGYESDASLTQAIKWGAISNIPISVGDISNANEIFGPCIASLKGKSTAVKATSQERTEINKLESKSISVIIDIISVRFFVLLSDPIDYFTCRQIESKSVTILSKVLASIIAMYRVLHSHCAV
jgi:hypothetical protein